MELRKIFQFEAAHLLPHLPSSQVCRLHGHSFQVEVVIQGPCDPTLGWVIDYAEISSAFRSLWEVLDHNYLNEYQGSKTPRVKTSRSGYGRGLSRSCHFSRKL
jgi:6-pyruvoyltetrahydropterin/6-carboxytetrahydropterin synthase